MTEARNGIIEMLAQLSDIYPGMRFGQLVSNITFWARGPAFEGSWDVDDGLFLETGRRHFERRCRQIEIAASGVAGSVSSTRADAFRVVEALGERCPERRFTELVAQVAEWAGATVYDIEDELLVETARKHLPTQPHAQTPDTALS